MQAELNSLGHFPILQFFGGLLVVGGVAVAVWRASADIGKVKPGSGVTPPALVAIGGALADRDTAEQLMQTYHELIKSINRLSRCVELANEDEARRVERLSETTDALRRSVDELSDIKRRKG